MGNNRLVHERLWVLCVCCCCGVERTLATEPTQAHTRGPFKIYTRAAELPSHPDPHVILTHRHQVAHNTAVSKFAESSEKEFAGDVMASDESSSDDEPIIEEEEYVPNNPVATFTVSGGVVGTFSAEIYLDRVPRTASNFIDLAQRRLLTMASTSMG